MNTVYRILSYPFVAGILIYVVFYVILILFLDDPSWGWRLLAAYVAADIGTSVQDLARDYKEAAHV